MARGIITLAALAVLGLARTSEAAQAAGVTMTMDEICLPTCETRESDGKEICTFYAKLDIFASETGYFMFEGCEHLGYQPTLGMRQNVLHVFDQTNTTNWYHPLGFAYGPDGVYGDNVELERAVPAIGNPDSDCADTYSCDCPQYKLNGENLVTDETDPEDFGLDEYEGFWFSGGRDEWIDAGNFTVEVNITDDSTNEIFAFCHIHNQMSFRIKILNAEGEMKNSVTEIEIPYEYVERDDFDVNCGTFNVSNYQGHEQCGDHVFHCNGDADTFNECFAAINCKMMTEMRTTGNNDPTAEFMYQMIAHHQNAVNMAKILLWFNPGSLKCGTSYDGRRRRRALTADGDDSISQAYAALASATGRSLDDSFCNDDNNDGGTPAVTMLWSIVNGQNQQITFMRSWLEDNLVAAFDYCEADESSSNMVAILVGCLVAIIIVPCIGFGAYYWYRKNKAAKAKLMQKEAGTVPAKTLAKGGKSNSGPSQATSMREITEV
mmetsp:Transcript_21096/g.37823  ORF Transcript_21096/g.37823 Transcript_21096/m.37823 type:complete len:492 (+) Transcript_21096:151-1626(+)